MISFRPHYDRGVHSSSNRNGYQEYFLGGRGGRCVGLTTLPPSCADYLEIWYFNFVEPLGPIQAFYRDRVCYPAAPLFDRQISVLCGSLPIICVLSKYWVWIVTLQTGLKLYLSRWDFLTLKCHWMFWIGRDRTFWKSRKLAENCIWVGRIDPTPVSYVKPVAAPCLIIYSWFLAGCMGKKDVEQGRMFLWVVRVMKLWTRDWKPLRE